MAIKYEAARGDFSSFGGLGLSQQVMKSAKLEKHLRDYMPVAQRTDSKKSMNKFMAMVYGMIVGNDCISDMDVVTKDPIFKSLCNQKTFTSQNYGSFLQSFTLGQISKINEELRRYALFLRSKSFPKDKNFIIDLDSTQHHQYAKKMEGVSFGYGNHYGLSSLHAYDQYGFQYYLDVRPGSSHTAKGAPSIIRELYKGISRKYSRFFRADSGYCNHGVMKACLESRANFVICMPSNMHEPILEKRNHSWWKWKPSQKVFFRDGRRADLLSMPYFVRETGKTLRVVFMRAEKKENELYSPYDYRAFVTDMSQSEMSDEEVICFYKKRGNAENFIKENKNAFDMHHFPCSKLSANKIWGLITAFAYNTLRAHACVLNKKVMHYSKRIRFRMIYLGAHVVKKSRYWVVRLNHHQHEEVKRYQCRFQKLLQPG